MDSERDTAPERHTEKYNLRVAGRQRYRHRFREGQKVRDGGPQPGLGTGRCGLRDSPPPYLGHAIPHDPGDWGPGAPPARRQESAWVTAALMAQARRL